MIYWVLIVDGEVYSYIFTSEEEAIDELDKFPLTCDCVISSVTVAT